MDFCDDVNVQHAVTKAGDFRYAQVMVWLLSKMSRVYLRDLLSETVNFNDIQQKSLPTTEDFPKNVKNVASIEKPKKNEAILNIKTRFSKLLNV